MDATKRRSSGVTVRRAARIGRRAADEWHQPGDAVTDAEPRRPVARRHGRADFRKPFAELPEDGVLPRQALFVDRRTLDAQDPRAAAGVEAKQIVGIPTFEADPERGVLEPVARPQRPRARKPRRSEPQS
jgi:hypothetical protein